MKKEDSIIGIKNWNDAGDVTEAITKPNNEFPVNARTKTLL